MALGSFNYVSARAPVNATQMVKEAPHVGPAWRTAEVCAYMLGRGIITWDDITHTIDATCELPPRYFTEALENIEELWSSIDGGLSKLSINSMIGLFSCPISYTYICKTKEPGFDDMLFEGTKRMRIMQEFGLEQVVTEYELVSNACMTPIHMQILDSEQLMLARMRNASSSFFRCSTCKSLSGVEGCVEYLSS